MTNILYEFDPCPIDITMERLSSNVRDRRLEKNIFMAIPAAIIYLYTIAMV